MATSLKFQQNSVEVKDLFVWTYFSWVWLVKVKWTKNWSNTVKCVPTLISSVTHLHTFSLCFEHFLGLLLLLADLIMPLHLVLASCITAGLVFIPIGCKLEWNWTKNRKLRLTHIILIGLITAETIVGLTCPLTILEYSFRNVNPPESFVSYWIEKVLYWNLPHQVFIAIYSFSLAWVFANWR